MGIGESLKKGLSATLRSIAILALYFGYGAVMNVANQRSGTQGDNLVPGLNKSFLIAAGTIVAGILIGIFMQAGLVAYMRDKITQGRAAFSVFFSGGLKYYWRFLRVGFIIIGMLLVAGAIALLLGNTIPPQLRALTLVITGLMVVVALYLVIVIMLAPYVIVTEEAALMPSLRKSIALVTDGAFWWTFFQFVCLLVMTVTVIPVLFVMVVCLVNEKARNNKFFATPFVRLYFIGVVLLLTGFLMGVLLGVVLGLIGLAFPAVSSSQEALSVLSSAVNAFIGVFMTATFTIFYFKLTHKDTAVRF